MVVDPKFRRKVVLDFEKLKPAQKQKAVEFLEGYFKDDESFWAALGIYVRRCKEGSK